MKIIGNDITGNVIKDYYDSFALSIQGGVSYIRDPSYIEYENKLKLFRKYNYNYYNDFYKFKKDSKAFAKIKDNFNNLDNTRLEFYTNVLCVAGKIYPIVTCSINNKANINKYISNLNTKNICDSHIPDLKEKITKNVNNYNFYNINDLEIFLIDNLDSKLVNSLLKDFTAFYNSDFSSINDVFYKLKTPVFLVLNNYYIFNNPRLADFEFYQILDVNQCYQEIRVFIDNNLCEDIKPDPIIAVNDKDLAKSKGYDKYSFRKDKKVIK